MKSNMEVFILNVPRFESALREMQLSQNEFSKVCGLCPQTFTRARKGHGMRMSSVRAILAGFGGRNSISDFFSEMKTKGDKIQLT